MTSNDPQMTLEWPKINPVASKYVLVLCGMIVLTSGPNLKTIGPPEQQIYGYVIVCRNLYRWISAIFLPNWQKH